MLEVENEKKVRRQDERSCLFKKEQYRLGIVFENEKNNGSTEQRFISKTLNKPI